MIVSPVTLTGKMVRLEPLGLDHLDGLCRAGLVPEIWTWNPSPVTNREEMGSYIAAALDEQARGVSLPFATRYLPTDEIVGSTRFGNIDVQNRKAEIGWTWINPAWQRTVVNTEAKYLMLRHGFETWNCLRVELKTDALNERSRNAIMRIGAQQEGILRQHMITASGRLRDTVYFSIIDSEWPDRKSKLEAKLHRAK